MSEPWEQEYEEDGPWNQSYEMPQINTSTGASAKARFLVGTAAKKDKLATLRQFYPDAAPFGDDNFVFTDPDTGEARYYNPKGFWSDPKGDLASIPIDIAEFGGGVAGGVYGGAKGARFGPLGALAGAAVGSGAGASGTKEGFRQAVQPFGIVDSRTAQNVQDDMLSTFAWNAGGELVAAPLAAGAKATGKGLLLGGKKGVSAAKRRLDVLRKAGAIPTYGMVSNNGVLRSTEHFLGSFPGGAGHIQRVSQETQEQIQKNVEKRAGLLIENTMYDPRQLTPGEWRTPGRVGLTVKNALINGTDNFKNAADEAYGKIDDFLPGSVSDEGEKAVEHFVRPDNTIGSLKEMTADFADAPALSKLEEVANPRLKKWLGAMQSDLQQDGTLSWQTIKGLRSAIGEQLSSPVSRLSVGDIRTGQYKKLYASLTQDMAQSLEGNPGALIAWKEADTMWKEGMDRIDGFVVPLIRKVEPEKIYRELELGGRYGPTKLAEVKKDLKPHEWQLLQSTLLRRMGKVAPSGQDDVGEAFSSNTFLANWNKLDAEAKDVLFGGSDEFLRRDLDDFAEAMAIVKQNMRPDSTMDMMGDYAGKGIIFGSAANMMYTGDPSLLVGAGLAMMGAKGSAIFLTSPKTARWLAQSTKLNPAGLSSHLAKLGAIANDTEDPNVRQAIVDFLQVLQDQGQEEQAGMPQGQ